MVSLFCNKDALSMFCLPTAAAQVSYLINGFTIDIKIYIKTAPTCFGVITIIRGCTIRSCLKLLLLK